MIGRKCVYVGGVEIGDIILNRERLENVRWEFKGQKSTANRKSRVERGSLQRQGHEEMKAGEKKEAIWKEEGEVEEKKGT